MKIKLLIISIAIALCLSAAPAMAGPHGAGFSGGTGSITRLGDHSSGSGGEFTIYEGSHTMLLTNANYADVARKRDGNAESFQTFCVEIGENTTEPQNIWVSTENAAGTGPGSHAYQGGPPGYDGDDLDPKTAYLYTMFATGSLAGYDYDHTLTRSASAAALQYVIWGIEGEASSGWAPAVGLETTFYDAAVLAVGSGGDWEHMGIGGVRVLQMWSVDRPFAQDQLYYVPVPAAVLLGILGLGIAGIKLRKFA